VVFFHELGHFLVARWNGIKVLTFSIGFGPELFGFNDRHGTRWKVSAIPLGGYVKFFGDDNAASAPDQSRLAAMTEQERGYSYHCKSVGARAAVVVAGPLANFVLAIVIFTGIFALYGEQNASARVDTVQDGSPAAAAGFKSGDLVLSIDGRRIQNFADMQMIVGTSAGQSLQIVVDRGGTPVTLHATPTSREIKDSLGNTHRGGVLGITRSMTPDDNKVTPVPLPRAAALAVEKSWFIAEQTFRYIGGIFTGRESADQLHGPAQIAQIAGEVWQQGFTNGGIVVATVGLFGLAAFLSVSIGLLNLFPIPLLDGGHLLFYAFEAVLRRPLSERAQEMGFRIGFALVLFLMIFATYNDRGIFAGAFQHVWRFLAS
jgi:regulator of sigma E protease